MGYGLRELIEKMTPGCHILTVDFDEALHEFFRDNNVWAGSSLSKDAAGAFRDSSTHADSAGADSGRISSVLLRSPTEIVNILNEGKLVPPPGSFKRAVVVKMSGGTVFSEEAYSAVTEYVDSFIQNFWKNHITLTRMGRMYALDIFKNLKAMEGGSGTNKHTSVSGAIKAAEVSGAEEVFAPRSDNLQVASRAGACRTSENIRPLKKESVSKPILVIGAGTSVDKLLPKLTGHKQNFFILCVDAALPALLQSGIRPDAVVAVECQVAIEKAYIGAAESGIHVIADLTSRPRVTRLCAGAVSFFLSEYCTMPFMTDIKTAARSLGIPVFPPLGSVGLYAVETALYIRKPATPVFVCGLDFSFVPGQTHCKGAPAHTAAAITANRLKPVGFPGAAYNYSAHTIAGKADHTEYTDAALSGYGALYAERYKSIENLFDCAETGMKSGIQRIAQDLMFRLAESLRDSTEAEEPIFASPAAQTECRYVENQLIKLLRIKAILTGNEKPRTATELEELIAECGYLYVHFPDCAAGFRMTQDFLNRIRAEVDVFLKALGNKPTLLSS